MSIVYIDLTKEIKAAKEARTDARKLAVAQEELRVLRKLLNRNIDRMDVLEPENERLRAHILRFAN